jgi:hypothetical protein
LSQFSLETCAISNAFLFSYVKEFYRISCMELGTGKKENVVRIWRLSFSLRSVLKVRTLVLYNLVDRSPVNRLSRTTASEFRSRNFTVLAFRLILLGILNGEGKAVPLQAWSGPEGSRKSRFPDFMITAQGGGKVVSITHWPPLPPGP